MGDPFQLTDTDFEDEEVADLKYQVADLQQQVADLMDPRIPKTKYGRMRVMINKEEAHLEEVADLKYQVADLQQQVADLKKTPLWRVIGDGPRVAQPVTASMS